jgi:hypothetical protein
MVGGSIVLAVISMIVLPRNIAYDPWSWLIWGRETIHLHLDTRQAATAVKPLPIFINTLFAPLGTRAAPDIWLFVARVAALLSLALVFRIAQRVSGVAAGLIAAIGLAVSDEYLGYLLMAGMSEPMATATVLAAVDSHLDSRRRATFCWLVAAGLLRPETWPFLVLYSLWLACPSMTWRPSTWRPQLTFRRVLTIVVAVAVPPVWFVIDWFGSRQFFRSAGAATHQSQGGPLLSREPGLATIHETWHLMSAPIVVLFLGGVVVAVVAWARTRRATPTIWFAAGAIGWLAVDALLAQGRFATGAPRYLLPGVALACVVAAVVFTDAVRLVIRRVPNPRAALAVGTVAALGLGGCFVPRFITTERQVHSGIVQGRQSAALNTSLKQAIARAGGRAGVLSCGQVITKNFQVPLLAWDLKIPVGAVGFVPAGHGIVLQDELNPRIPVDLRSDYHFVAAVGPPNARWTILTTC